MNLVETDSILKLTQATPKELHDAMYRALDANLSVIAVPGVEAFFVTSPIEEGVAMISYDYNRDSRVIVSNVHKPLKGHGSVSNFFHGTLASQVTPRMLISAITYRYKPERGVCAESYKDLESCLKVYFKNKPIIEAFIFPALSHT